VMKMNLCEKLHGQVSEKMKEKTLQREFLKNA
jgi:hypothetical protein